MVVHKAAPVEQVEHGLKAEHGLLRQLGVVGDHEGARLQLDGLVCLRPGKLLEPHLGRQEADWCQAVLPKFTHPLKFREKPGMTYMVGRSMRFSWHARGRDNTSFACMLARLKG